MVQKDGSSTESRQINYKTMRRVVGLIAFFLAPTTIFLADASHEINSISATYWTNSGDLFVGSLIAVGFFLFAYNGTGGRDWEYYLSKAASGFAILVALFPTSAPGSSPPTWTVAITNLIGLEPRHLHYISAVALFACLFLLLTFFAKRAKRKKKLSRSRAYWTLACLMVAGMALIGAVGWYVDWPPTILWVEVWGLTFFGLGWLLAGFYVDETVRGDNQAFGRR